MDPALRVMSPFSAVGRGMGAALDDVVDATPGPFSTGNTTSTWEEADSLTTTPAGTPCSFCGAASTTCKVPKDGLYICPSCVARQGSQPRHFPLGTFKCCPTATDAIDGDVLRCAKCQRWYHAHCVGLSEGVLRNYAALSTTSWYCPEPLCCERILQRHLKRYVVRGSE